MMQHPIFQKTAFILKRKLERINFTKTINYQSALQELRIWCNSRIYSGVIALRENWTDFVAARAQKWKVRSYICELIACPGRRVSLRRRFTLLLFRDTRWNGREMLLGCESILAEKHPVNHDFIRVHRKGFTPRNKLALTNSNLIRSAFPVCVQFERDTRANKKVYINIH